MPAIALVGIWKGVGYNMHFDTVTGHYIARGFIKRAVHEYQYVAGEFDEDSGMLRGADPSLIEGNVNFNSEPYFVFVYYHDNASGGFDRIVGAGAQMWGG